jgi:hypothetical protein
VVGKVARPDATQRIADVIRSFAGGGDGQGEPPATESAPRPSEAATAPQ